MTAFVFPSGFEWVIILVVVLLVFGHRIPSMARSLGSGIVEFKKGLRSGDNEKLEAGKQGAEIERSHTATQQQEAKP